MSMIVSTLVVEWIEIDIPLYGYIPYTVSTLVVEWIEIAMTDYIAALEAVSTLVVEWIEIVSNQTVLSASSRLHPRGGVD